MRKLIAFDLDDTLFKEMCYVASGYMAVAESVAKATGANATVLYDILEKNRPLGYEAIAEHIKGLPGSEMVSVESMTEIYNTHTPDIMLSEGAESVLPALKEAGHTLALITDGASQRQRAKIKALGLDRFFAPEAILISEETGGDKSTEIPWRAAEARFGAESFIYVGDNPAKDFRVPNLRGWQTVMLRDREGKNVHTQHPADLRPEYRARICIDSLTDLTQML